MHHENFTAAGRTTLAMLLLAIVSAWPGALRAATVHARLEASAFARLPLDRDRVTSPPNTDPNDTPVLSAADLAAAEQFDRDAFAWLPVMVVVPQGHRAIAVRAQDGDGAEIAARIAGTSGYAGYQVALVQVARPRRDAGNVRIAVETTPSEIRALARQRHDPDLDRRTRRRLQLQVANPEALNEYGPAIPATARHAAAPKRAGGFRPAVDPALDGSGVRYLIVTTQELVAAFEPLAAWKTRRGVPTQIRTIEWIESRTRRGVDRAETLRNFLTEAYALWGVEYVLLGGDTALLPARFAFSTVYGGSYSPADLYFACLDGTWNADGDVRWGEGALSMLAAESDILPELAVARAPVNNVSETQAFVSRVLAYETPAFTDYQNRAIFLAEVLIPANWDSGMTVTYDGAIGSEQMIAESVPPSMQVQRLYDTHWLYPGATELTKEATVAAMNDGRGIVNHLGHGFRYTMSLGNSSLVNADADALSNGERSFVLCMANCAAAAYDYNCLAERFLLNPGGGAAGIIGAARSVSASLIVTYNRAFHRRLFTYGQVHLADLLNELRLERAALAEFEGSDRWITFSLNALGDAEMPIFTALPRASTLAHADSLGLGPDSLAVLVQVDSLPAPNVAVCAEKAGEVYAVAQTDAAGMVHLPVAPETPGPLFLTVSGENLIVRTDTLQVVPSPTVPHLVFEGATIDDDSLGASRGNDDGSVDAGETLELWIALRNTGGAAADSVTAIAGSSDARLVVEHGAVAVGHIGPDSTGSAVDSVVVRVLPSVSDGTVLRLGLEFRDAAARTWNDTLRILVGAPRTEVTRVVALGAAGAATARYQIELENYGSGKQPQLTGTLTCSDSTVNVLAPATRWDVMSQLGTILCDSILAIQDTIPGPAANLQLQITDVYGRTFMHRFDQQPPPKPALPVADLASSVGGVHLTWTPTVAADLLGYHVFRSPDTSIFARITPDIVHHAEYFDTGVLANASYRYCVVAVDSSRQWGAVSDTVVVNTTAALLSGWPLDMTDPTASSPAVGDLDGDGTPEVVVGSKGVYAWHANGQEVRDGDGVAATLGVFTIDTGTMNASVALAQMDAQPGLEIVAASWLTNRIYVWRADGSLLPGWPREPSSGGNTGYWGSPAIADLDGDGVLEVAIVSKDGWLYVWHADGTPLLPATNGAVRQVGAWTQTTPAFADLDGDGHLEIVVSGATANVYVLRDDGSDFPGWPQAMYAFGKSSPAIGDLDADGDLEIVVPSESDHIWVYQTDGTQLPGWPKSSPQDAPDFGPSVSLGDLDGNSTLEVVLVSVKNPWTSSKLRVYDYQGNILLEKQLELNSQSSPILADLDGDGGLEIVHGGEAGVLHAWNIGGQELAGFPIAIGDYARATPVYCDLDLDGGGDLVFAGWNKRVYVWKMAGPYRPERAPWPSFHRDNRRTGFLPRDFATPAAEPPSPPARLSATWAPNPFNPSITVRFHVPADGARVPVTVLVYDARGRRVRTLVDAALAPGSHAAMWDGRDDRGNAVGSGTYLLRIRAGNDSLAGKLTLVR